MYIVRRPSRESIAVAPLLNRSHSSQCLWTNSISLEEERGMLRENTYSIVKHDLIHEEATGAVVRSILMCKTYA